LHGVVTNCFYGAEAAQSSLISSLFFYLLKAVNIGNITSTTVYLLLLRGYNYVVFPIPTILPSFLLTA